MQTKQAKPTAGPYHNNLCKLEGEPCIEIRNHRQERVAFVFREEDIAVQAFNVFHETGLTPRELLEKVKKLEQIIELNNATMRECL